VGDSIIPTGQVLLYSDKSGREYINVYFQDETFWLTQKVMAELFDVKVPAISKHLQNIYEEELERAATVSKMETVQNEGGRTVRRSIDFYNLDAIIAAGYRQLEKSDTPPPMDNKNAQGVYPEGICPKRRADEKRTALRQELLRRTSGTHSGNPCQRTPRLPKDCGYLRAMQLRLRQNSETTRAFYAFVQNKLHFAVTGKTAAELISERATLDSPTMGLTTWKCAPDGEILKSDVLAAKNYLNEKEIARLNRLMTMFIDYAELMAEDEQLMSMKDWLAETDQFLTNNRRKGWYFPR